MAQISVVVPVYKVEPFLARCVESILAQTFQDFELLLVDDGSPDNCGVLCDAYGDRDGRIRVFHRENGGLSAARNTALDWIRENSCSQWITFVDSDDWLHRDYLCRLYDGVQQTGCRISACTYYVTTGETEPAGAEAAVHCLSADDYYCGSDIRAVPVACAKLYHRSLFADLRFPLQKLHEDEFTTYRAVYAAESVAYIPEALYAYYQNPDGIMLSRWNPRRLHILEAFEQQIRDAEAGGLERLYRKAVRDYIYSIHEQLQRSDEGYHQELRRKYRKALKLGRDCGSFPVCWDLLWAYEEAYPVKLFWWPLFKGRQLLGRKDGQG